MRIRSVAECHMCLRVKKVEHVNIYHMGSEGLEACTDCLRILTNLVQGIRSAAFANKLDDKLKEKGVKKDEVSLQ